MTFRRQVSDGAIWWLGTAELALNPTTWVVHQPTTLWRTPPEDWLNVPPVMFSGMNDLYDAWEKLLVGQNNVVIGTSRHVALARPDVWRVQLHRYVDGVFSALDGAIARASERAGMLSPPPIRDMKLKTVETYWEQWSTSPLSEMARLENSFRRIASRSTVTWQQIEPEAASVLVADGQIDVGTYENSPRVNVRLATGVECSIYAKTTRRIRLEVIHQVRDARSAFPSRYANSISSLMILIDQAANDAALKLNSIWSWAQPLGNIVPSERRQPHELVAAVFCALGPLEASDIVNALVANRRFVVSPGSPFRAAVQALKRRGVLRSAGRVGQDRIWIVTDEYEAALDSLRCTR